LPVILRTTPNFKINKTDMGFNLSGLVINKNYSDDFEGLQKQLGWNLIKQDEINFETASSNWTDEGICNVYFLDKGTLMFINMDMCTDGYPLKNDNTLTFALSETSMAFNINYCENGIEKRSIMEVNGERMQNEGNPLEVEEKSGDTSEIIWNQIEVVLGKSFWNIEPDEKAMRYVFTTNNGQSEIAEQDFDINTPISKDDISNKFSDTELFNLFDEILKFAQTNQINIFLHPWAHKDNSRKFMNLFSIVEEISKRPNVTQKIESRMPLERFKMICRFDPDKVDDKTNKQMLQELNKIKLGNNDLLKTETAIETTEKKWWLFWK
jgi:hypothetical protein